MIKVKEEVIKENKEFIPIHFDDLFYKVFGDYNDLESLKYLIKQILNVEPVEIQILNGNVLGDKYIFDRDKVMNYEMKLEKSSKKGY